MLIVAVASPSSAREGSAAQVRVDAAVPLRIDRARDLLPDGPRRRTQSRRDAAEDYVAQATIPLPMVVEDIGATGYRLAGGEPIGFRQASRP